MGKVPFVDQDICIGCGICINNIHEGFHLTGAGKMECFIRMEPVKRKFGVKPSMHDRQHVFTDL